MVQIAAAQSGDLWFGIAYAEEELVATAFAASRFGALDAVSTCIPDGVASQVVPEPDQFVTKTTVMLAALHAGDERHKRFTISAEFVPPAQRRTLMAAAAIPVGYVTTYGRIAEAAGSVARAVGRMMATNPLYPVVPCHRVVGAQMSLVGYGGRQDRTALAAKLGRLRAEARGYTDESCVQVEGMAQLTVYPVEWVIRTEHRSGEVEMRDNRQLLLF